MQFEEIQALQKELSLEKNLDIPIESILKKIEIFEKGISTIPATMLVGAVAWLILNTLITI